MAETSRILVLIFYGIIWTNANSDGDALLAVKSQLGSSNPNLSNWLGPDPCSKPLWNGVLCTNDRVTTLNLSYAGLRGSFPEELGNLTMLNHLDLQGNLIGGPVPKQLSGLLALKSINLTGNPLQEPFPSSILNIKGLVELRLNECNLTGSLPDEILTLTSLQVLHLLDNNLTGSNILDLVSRASQLTDINLSGNMLNTSLSALPRNIINLSINKCGLQGPLPEDWGFKYKGIQLLDLQENNFTGEIPESWNQLRNLTSLMLSGNMLRGFIPSWLSSLLLPANIYLKCNYFSGPAPPPEYRKNNVKGNCFDDDLRDHTRQCPNEEVVLGCTSFFKLFPRPPPPPPPPPTAAAAPPVMKPSKHRLHAGVVAGITIGAVAIASILALLVLRRFKKAGRKAEGEHSSDSDMTEPLKDWPVPKETQMFSMDEISRATEGFSKENEIGTGAFGRVFRGTLDDGRVVAIKQASGRKSKQSEFRNEIILLSRLHHRHLVSLLGFCQTSTQQILVYEFMENGDLHDHLLGKFSKEPLDWSKRVEIAICVAQGLDYLHFFADPPVIHRDLKPSNILLDRNMVAKIADFGISKVSPEFDTHVSTKPAGTAGYFDPEYFLRRQLTTASDVYSYGVVVLELITGQKAIDHTRTDEVNLVEWVKLRLSAGDVYSIADSRLGQDFSHDLFSGLATIALQCTVFDRSKRPSIRMVLAFLQDHLRESEMGSLFTSAPSTTTMEDSSELDFSMSLTSR